MLHPDWDTWRQDYGILQVAEYRYLICLEQAHEGRWTPRPCDTGYHKENIALHISFYVLCCIRGRLEMCVNVHANVYGSMQDETSIVTCLVSLSDIFLSLQNLSVKYLSLELRCREHSPGTHIVGGFTISL